jgi:hypothetical protein
MDGALLVSKAIGTSDELKKLCTHEQYEKLSMMVDVKRRDAGWGKNHF